MSEILKAQVVHLLERRISIRTDLSDERLLQIEGYTNQMLRKCVGENPNDLTKHLLLAAMSLAAEVLAEREKAESLHAEITRLRADAQQSIQKMFHQLNELD